MIYEYKCTICQARTDSTKRASDLTLHCQREQVPTPHRRVYSFSVAPVMQEHFNNAVGAPVSDMGRFKALLRQRSDEATERTGIEHRFVPVDMHDSQAVGATNEGIHETNIKRSRIGAPLLPEVK